MHASQCIHLFVNAYYSIRCILYHCDTERSTVVQFSPFADNTKRHNLPAVDLQSINTIHDYID